jgi:membrane-bound metal-dependent hydrolase YbcI (DUF457 family)
MLLIALIILVLWAAGAFVPTSPIRGNNLVHVLLVIGLIILVYWALTGGMPRLYLPRR